MTSDKTPIPQPTTAQQMEFFAGLKPAKNSAQQFEHDILEKLKQKKELIFAPGILTQEQKDVLKLMRYAEDIYSTITESGYLKIWRRIFN